mmetsp:Transcript_3041/g.9364  ORF Transcript_3041/g.9364 Transcript_3041/m.9364 type:complete len:233 (-) Transcript_3041:972-1670(-)
MSTSDSPLKDSVKLPPVATHELHCTSSVCTDLVEAVSEGTSLNWASNCTEMMVPPSVHAALGDTVDPVATSTYPNLTVTGPTPSCWITVASSLAVLSNAMLLLRLVPNASEKEPDVAVQLAYCNSGRVYSGTSSRWSPDRLPVNVTDHARRSAVPVGLASTVTATSPEPTFDSASSALASSASVAVDTAMNEVDSSSKRSRNCPVTVLSGSYVDLNTTRCTSRLFHRMLGDA